MNSFCLDIMPLFVFFYLQTVGCYCGGVCVWQPPVVVFFFANNNPFVFIILCCVFWHIKEVAPEVEGKSLYFCICQYKPNCFCYRIIYR